MARVPMTPDSWDYYHQPTRGKRITGQRDQGLPEDAWAPWGPLDVEESELFDVKNVDWAIAELGKSHDKPFFIACGFVKPHLPWFAPGKYFDLHPVEHVILPPTLENDRDDLPYWGKKFASEVHSVSEPRNVATHGEDHHMVLRHNQWRRAVQSYLATISYVDVHVGRLLDALDNSPHADNTIVVLWGDHGWHLGEKQRWRKHALWEVTTRTTLVIAGSEGIAQNVLCERPVSLIDLYPTLLELCGLPSRENLDGQSLAPLLRDPTMAWDHPVIMTYGYQNHAVRTDRWRYIRYNDGGEELYDHTSDPNEWHNLASQEQYQSIKVALGKSLPLINRR